MNKHIHILSLCCLFLLLSFAAYSQPDVPNDEKAREYVDLGKKYMKFKKYEDAARTFEVASDLPFNQLTTAALLYRGIALFQLQKWDQAQKQFDKLVMMYPRSRYTEDALYHQALITLEQPGEDMHERGLNTLFEYSDKFTDSTLQVQAWETAKYYLFNRVSLNFLNNYYIVAPEKHKTMVLEAIIARLVAENQAEMVKERIEMNAAAGGTTTDYMNRAKMHFSGVSQDFSGGLKVAIMLPFNLQHLDTATVVPVESQTALSLFEGMQLGMDSLSKKYDRAITTMVFDTRGNPDTIANQLPALEKFMPHFIVGDIRNSASRPIAEWAEQMGIVQMVPLSPSKSLVKERKNIFLAHPSVERHAAAIAEFAFTQRKHRDFVVFNDGTKYPTIQATAFSKRLEELGGRVVKEVTVPTGPLNKETVTLLASRLNELKGLTFDAIYVPLSSEEHAGLIISRMNWIPIKTNAYGSPDWENFAAIDPELMETFQLTISTPYYLFNDSLSLEKYKLYYYDHFTGDLPNKEHIQGFDIINQLLTAAESHNPMDPFSKTLENAAMYRGIHQNMGYSEQHDNQEVNIVQMIQNRWVKVNHPPVAEDFDINNDLHGPNAPDNR